MHNSKWFFPAGEQRFIPARHVLSLRVRSVRCSVVRSWGRRGGKCRSRVYVRRMAVRWACLCAAASFWRTACVPVYRQEHVPRSILKVLVGLFLTVSCDSRRRLYTWQRRYRRQACINLVCKWLHPHALLIASWGRLCSTEPANEIRLGCLR